MRIKFCINDSDLITNLEDDYADVSQSTYIEIIRNEKGLLCITLGISDPPDTLEEELEEWQP